MAARRPNHSAWPVVPLPGFPFQPDRYNLTMDWLRNNRIMVTAISAGALIVLAIALASTNTSAIIWSGLAVGIAVGAVIGATTGRK